MITPPSEDFQLHPHLLQKTFVTDLALCRVLLEDNAHYPWIFLVPRRRGLKRLMEVEKKDQLQLLEELESAQKVLWESFELTQINVAAIGNKTAQLHIHVIGRKEGDPAWPGTVWDREETKCYSDEEKSWILRLLRYGFHRFKTQKLTL